MNEICFQCGKKYQGTSSATDRLCPACLRTKLSTVTPEDQIKTLKAELTQERLKWEELKGRLCPEDFGFEEYIKSLESRLKEAKAENEKLKEQLRDKKEERT